LPQRQLADQIITKTLLPKYTAFPSRLITWARMETTLPARTQTPSMEFASLRVIALPDCLYKVITVTKKWRIESMGRFYDPAEDTVVYFDSHSGDTHLLSDFAAHIMQQLGDQHLNTEELVNRISPAIESSNIPELTMAVSGVLEELVALDILKRE